jgi:hypothetical protein
LGSWYLQIVTPKSLALVVGCALVLAMGVYLFVQVRAAPAPVTAPGGTGVRNVAAPASPLTRTQRTESGAEVRTTAPAMGPGPGAAARQAVRSSEPEAAPEPADDEPQRANPRFDSMMELANKAYDRQDFDEAIAIASKVLSKDPSNVRMLRIVVSSNCIAGDSALAQEHFQRLPKFDRDQMRTRCDRYGVTLVEP